MSAPHPRYPSVQFHPAMLCNLTHLGDDSITLELGRDRLPVCHWPARIAPAAGASRSINYGVLKPDSAYAVELGATLRQASVCPPTLNSGLSCATCERRAS